MMFVGACDVRLEDVIGEMGIEMPRRPTFIESNRQEWDRVRAKAHEKFSSGNMVKRYHSIGEKLVKT